MYLRTSTIIWLVILAIILAILSWAVYYVLTLSKPTPGNCDNVKKADPTAKWSDDCSYIEEVVPDSSLKVPTKALYLQKFTGVSSIGPPLGANTWYRYRYVRASTGGYGKFSPWTPSPIIAGSVKLPCKNGDCSGMDYSGRDSCKSNLPVLAVSELAYNVGSGVYANVHRVATPTKDAKPPSDNAKDEIVGFLTPSSSGVQFVDITTPNIEKKIPFNRPSC